MEFLVELFTSHSVPQSVFVFSLVIAIGLALGSIPVFGIRLGVAGVLFAGLLFGHFQIAINEEILHFAREFGLILFVYSIGLQVGPGFFSSFKQQGVILNALAAANVTLGATIAVCLSKFGHIPLPAAVGLLSGATTNTPSLGAAQQALKQIPDIAPEVLAMPGLGYAVAYPFGIIGVILSMLAIRWIARANPQKEAELFTQERKTLVPSIEALDVRVENHNLNGLTVSQIPGLKGTGVIISRVVHDKHMQVASADTKIFSGDILRIVGSKDKLDEVQMIIGSPCPIDMSMFSTDIQAREVIVTRHMIDGKTIVELNARERYGVTITRINRTDVELVATFDTQIRLADRLMVVGPKEQIDRFAKDVGNSPKQLDHPFIIPIFIGIALGVLVGSWPIHVPGVPFPVKLGLAGGPLLVSIILSYFGRIGRVIWYLPNSANFMLREMGIVLFLACVGLKSGNKFVETLLNGDGLYWMACATLITFLPVMIVSLIARFKWKMNYLTVCGLLAGSMTDPPALAFANSMTASNAPSISYATVYPLVMLLRVVLAQLIVLIFM